MTAGLEGATIVVTRSRPQAATLIAAIEAAGGRPIGLALLEIRDALDGGKALEESITNATSEDWLVVLSRNAAIRLPDANRFLGQVAAIGSGTASALTDRGWSVDLLPEVESSTGLLAAFAEIEVGGRVVIAQAEGGRPELAEGLAERGVDVRAVHTYRNVMPEIDVEASALAKLADVVVFASPTAAERYSEHIGSSPSKAVCIGEVTGDTARTRGFQVHVAAAPTVEAILTALEGCVAS